MNNAAAKIDDSMREDPRKVALWLPDLGSLSFADLDVLSRRAASALLAKGIRPGDRILLFVDLNFDLYAWIVAAARLGISIVLVEPWMALSRIERIVAAQSPKVFVASTLGRLWGLRIGAVRKIPHHVAARDIHGLRPDPHATESVDSNQSCIITFTSGSTGEPKGMVRTHGYLKAQLAALNDSLDFSTYRGPDLCIFANFALANLANGRTSLVMPSKWRAQHLAMLHGLKGDLAPETTTAGPAFMELLLAHGGPGSLRGIHVGGALTDNALFERVFARWPEAHVTHVYGSTEAEPVAHVDARLAVMKSRERGYFQTLCLGHPWQGLKAQIEEDQLWIQGPHVSPEYLHNAQANALFKRRDAQGALWHRMGDRIVVHDGYWYFAGRERQKRSDFEIEQRLYSALGHSRAFIQRTEQGELDLYVEPMQARTALLARSIVPEARYVFATRIIRDKRHRARIDREMSMHRARKMGL